MALAPHIASSQNATCSPCLTKELRYYSEKNMKRMRILGPETKWQTVLSQLLYFSCSLMHIE